MTAAEADAAIQRIIDRHRTVDDPDLWQLDRDPTNVLVYLQRHRGGLPRSVIEADLLDGLVLRVRLWWLGEEAELWLLERALRLQISPRRIGKLLGVRSRQGVHDRLGLARAKIARLRGDAPRPTIKDSDQDKQEHEARWINRYRSDVLAVARTLVAHRDLLDAETAEWVIEINRDLKDNVVTPGSIQLIRFALADLVSSPSFSELAIDHELREANSRWSALYASYSRRTE